MEKILNSFVKKHKKTVHRGNEVFINYSTDSLRVLYRQAEAIGRYDGLCDAETMMKEEHMAYVASTILWTMAGVFAGIGLTILWI